MSENTSLVLLSRADQALAEANTVVELKELKDMALTAADWLRRKNASQDIIRKATGLAFEAEKKMGSMLAEKPPAYKSGPGRGIKGGDTRELPFNAPTLTDLGITKRESSDAQVLAKLPDKTFEAVKTGEKTRTQVKREIKEEKRQERRDENYQKVAATENIESVQSAFATIVIDPPWDWGDEGDVDQLGRARPTYETMSFEQLLALPVAKLADTDCHLYLWITNRSLPKGFALLDAWGFRYITALTWCKPSFGMGNYFRGSSEHVLFGVKGSQPLKRKDVGTWFSAPRGTGGHSSKPPQFLELVESCSPGPYLEMFARGQRDGWIGWGADVPV